MLQTASKVFETEAKAELKKQTSDKKSGETTLQKISSGDPVRGPETTHEGRGQARTTRH